MVPFVGWGADATLFGLDIERGNYFSAMASAVGFIPVVGDIGGPLARSLHSVFR